MIGLRSRDVLDEVGVRGDRVREPLRLRRPPEPDEVHRDRAVVFGDSVPDARPIPARRREPMDEHDALPAPVLAHEDLLAAPVDEPPAVAPRLRRHRLTTTSPIMKRNAPSCVRYALNRRFTAMFAFDEMWMTVCTTRAA